MGEDQSPGGPVTQPGTFADSTEPGKEGDAGYIPGCVGCGGLLLLASLVVLWFGLTTLDLSRVLGSEEVSVLAFFVAALLAIWGIWFLVNARERRP